ncbi:MAG: DUF116 domain-containing protein [Candidatus Krumholzibacteria bacterium]|nr:DUF116 domain-containing protein [Candidatus Krumholzibacteria bacterium]
MNDERVPPLRDRNLGDEWLDWKGADEPSQITEGKRTYLLLSLAVLVGFVLLGFLFWYLALPRFEQYGSVYSTILTIIVVAGAAFFLIWYAILIGAVVSQRVYLAICLHRRSNLFIMLFPAVARLAQSFGISRDRLSHSFIEVSNRLVGPWRNKNGLVLALVPRCLKKDLKTELKAICADFPNVVLHTAPGGTEARRIIRAINPSAIVAVACERDLVTGIHDVAPKIPVIGIPNTRPLGPCKDTSLDIEKFRSALLFFCKDS